MSLDTRFLLTILLSTLMVLLIPLVAMQFSNAVNWSLEDFVVAGFLLFVSGLIVGNIWRGAKKPAHKLVITLSVLLLLFLVLIELAVGIFGSPLAGN